MESLSIGAVARITGLSEFTLRAWERRYEVVQPQRRSSGRRVYTRADVEKLSLLQKLTLGGYAIGDIVHLSTADLERMIRKEQGSAAVTTGSGIGFESSRDHVNEMLATVRALDVSGLTSLLRTRQMQHNTRAFLLDIVALFLRELGESVQRGGLDVYHEHVASAVVRNYLTGILFATEQVARTEDQPPIVFATPEGDLHEFGILIAGLLAMMRSRRVLFLGPNVPFGSLERAARLTKSPMVVIGVSAPEKILSDSVLMDYVKNLEKRLSVQTKIWIGGDRNHALNKIKSHRIQLFTTFQQFERALQEQVKDEEINPLAPDALREFAPPILPPTRLARSERKNESAPASRKSNRPTKV